MHVDPSIPLFTKLLWFGGEEPGTLWAQAGNSRARRADGNPGLHGRAVRALPMLGPSGAVSIDRAMVPETRTTH